MRDEQLRRLTDLARVASDVARNVERTIRRDDREQPERERPQRDREICEKRTDVR